MSPFSAAVLSRFSFFLCLSLSLSLPLSILPSLGYAIKDYVLQLPRARPYYPILERRKFFNLNSFSQVAEFKVCLFRSWLDLLHMLENDIVVPPETNEREPWTFIFDLGVHAYALTVSVCVRAC